MKQILFKLFFVIAIVELLLMFSLSLIDIGSDLSWLMTLLDALIISITAIITVSFFIKKGLFSIQQYGRSAWVEIQIGLIVFFIEIIIMQVFEYQDLEIEEWLVAIIDAFSLAFFAALGIYFIALKPALNWKKKSEVTDAVYMSTEITLFFGYLSVMTILLMYLVLSYQQRFNELKNDIIKQEVSSLSLIDLAFRQQLTLLKSDVLSISNQPGVIKFLDDPSDENKRFLMASFTTQAQFKPEYDQIRLLNHSGKELIRIQQNENRAPVSIDSHALQDKSDRYYFKEGLSLKPGQVYLSKIDLNKEHGQIDLPYKPVIRVASVVRSSNNTPAVFVLNLKAQKMLDTLENLSFEDNVDRQFLDQDGYRLMGGNDDSQWGFMFPDKQNNTVRLEQPELWAAFQQSKQGVLGLDKHRLVFHKIVIDEVINQAGKAYLQEKQHWFLVSHIADSNITGQLLATKTLMFYAFMFISILFAIGVYLLVQALRQKEKAQSDTLLMVYTDFLTGLKNRKYFQWKLIREIYSAKKQQSKLAILYIDLNKFKVINDEMGHEAGDLVLKEIGSVLLKSLRDDDTVARIGGDEFAAILPNVVTDNDLEIVCHRIITCITDGLNVGGMNIFLGINIGIATLNNYDEPIRSFIARADQAMYEANASPSDNFVFADKYRTV